MTMFSRLAVTLAAVGFCAQAAAKPMTAVIRLKSKVSMEQLARQVLDPQSPRYHHYYTPEEIRALSAPDQNDYEQVLRDLRQEGFQIVRESKTHLWVSVHADSSLFATVFSTPLKVESLGLHKPLLRPLVPNRLGLVANVIGLDNTRKAHPQFKKFGALKSKPGGISQADIKSGYGFNSLYQAGIYGQGQDIAIATYDGFNMDDVNQFYKLSKLPYTPKVDQVTFNGTPEYNDGSAGETELDAEFSGMIAPAANIHVYASATNDDAGELQMFTAILDDNKAKIVNYSWGDCEPDITSTHVQEMSKVFARAVAQGVNIMVASGDSGSDSCGNGSLAADWPAANPNVVAIGGTSFSYKKGTRQETAWSCGLWGCTGGGISSLFDLPSYQTSLSAPYVKRSYPDVSFNADPQTGEAMYYSDGSGKGGYQVVGGTSMAAPQWSGLLALIGQARASMNKGPLGYLNPLIYSATSTEMSVIFDDITSGSNGAYNAGTGWDAVTGLGTPNASALVDYLSTK